MMNTKAEVLANGRASGCKCLVLVSLLYQTSFPSPSRQKDIFFLPGVLNAAKPFHNMATVSFSMFCLQYKTYFRMYKKGESFSHQQDDLCRE